MAIQITLGCLPGAYYKPSAGRSNCNKPFEIIGAGEGIRTLDPNLGKVVLYP